MYAQLAAGPTQTVTCGAAEQPACHRHDHGQSFAVNLHAQHVFKTGFLTIIICLGPSSCRLRSGMSAWLGMRVSVLISDSPASFLTIGANQLHWHNYKASSATTNVFFNLQSHLQAANSSVTNCWSSLLHFLGLPWLSWLCLLQRGSVQIGHAYTSHASHSCSLSAARPSQADAGTVDQQGT